MEKANPVPAPKSRPGHARETPKKGPQGPKPPGIHRFRRARLRGDYLRGGAGALIALGPLIFTEPAPVPTLIFGSLAVAFLWFLGRTLRRHRLVLESHEQGLCWQGGRIPWAELSALRLRRYGGGKDPGSGWLEMTLRAGPTRLALDSDLEGFLPLLRRAARAASDRGLTLDRKTQLWLAALGHDPARFGRPEGRSAEPDSEPR